jgi:hypothetical protein
VIPTDVHKNVSRKIADAAALITRVARSLMLLLKCVLALAAVHRVPRRTVMAESDFYRCALNMFSQDRRRSGLNNQKRAFAHVCANMCIGACRGPSRAKANGDG